VDVSGWLNKLLLVIVACVAAPIVEETMFRGVLYRHLRGMTAGWRTALSAIASGTVAGFIFAVIHPQGFVAVPALMALAYGFTLLREWRGTIIPGIVAHSLNNAIAMTALFLIFSD
jgi:membrane protease YdiL (CAAX protease family)